MNTFDYWFDYIQRNGEFSLSNFVNQTGVWVIENKSRCIKYHAFHHTLMGITYPVIWASKENEYKFFCEKLCLNRSLNVFDVNEKLLKNLISLRYIV